MAVIVCFGRLICDIMRNIIIFRDCNHVVNFRSSHSSQFKSQKISLYQKLYSHSISGMIPGIYFKDYLFFLVDHVYGSVGPGMSRMSSRFTGKIDLLNVKYINGTSVPTDVVVWISEPWTLSKHLWKFVDFGQKHCRLESTWVLWLILMGVLRVKGHISWIGWSFESFGRTSFCTWRHSIMMPSVYYVYEQKTVPLYYRFRHC